MMSLEIIPNLLVQRAYLTPHRAAFIFEDQEVTFLELYEQAQSVAERLTTLGVKKEDHVGVLLRNHIEMVYILFGIQLLGCIAVFLNNRLSSSEIEFQIKDSNTILLITEEKYKTIVSELKSPFTCKEDLFKQKRTPFCVLEEINLNDICSIMYTSGTTGIPKGVLQTYGNHWWSATGSALNLGVYETDRWICAVPLFHISGFSILMRSIIYGMTVILHESFDEENVLKEIISNRASIISVVSTMLMRILEKINSPLPSTFRCALAGGGPLPKHLLEECVKKNVPVYQTYGMTETASQVVTLSPEDSLVKLGSAGKPLFPVQLKIKNSLDTEAKPLESGEIFIKGPNVTIGYLNRPSVTKEKIQNGWLATGDIGYLDKDGFLFVQDRRSDLIISGGENIYPAEVEGILQSHDQVLEAGVIGIEDHVWGQVPVAVVVKKTGTSLSVEQLLEFCIGKLAKYKVPKKIVFLEELPRNAAKKLMRHKLKSWWKATQSEN
jgi:O-succinylbenzoic acid--CoA ligase